MSGPVWKDGFEPKSQTPRDQRELPIPIPGTTLWALPEDEPEDEVKTTRS